MGAGLHQHVVVYTQSLDIGFARPHDVVDYNRLAEQFRFVAHRDACIGCIYIDHVLLWPAAWQAEAFALTNRYEFESIYRTRFTSVFVYNARWAKWDAIAQKGFAAACLADETNILTVGFGGSAQAQLDRPIANLRFS